VKVPLGDATKITNCVPIAFSEIQLDVLLLLIQLGDVLNFNKENCGAPFTSLRFVGSTSGLVAGAQMSDVTLGASKDGSLARRDLKFNLIAGYFPQR
jgi:hypothetical protein